MFPEVDLDEVFQEIEDNDEFVFNGTSFLYDFKKGDFVYKNGNPIKVTGKEAIKIWIEKAIRTRIYNYNIYSNIEEDGYLSSREYGSGVIELVKGKKLPNLVVKAEAQRDIEEMVSANPFIKRIENFDLVTRSDVGKDWEAKIIFDAITIYEDENRVINMEVSI